MALTSSARTVTPRVLWAEARHHESSLRVFAESADWAAVRRPAIVLDPEWLYHESARDACATVSAQLFSDALGLTHAGAQDRGLDLIGSPAVTPRVVSVVAYLEAVSGSRCEGERELIGRPERRRGTVRGMLAVVRRGGRLHATGGD
ncbi:MAG TPA: hypothetical protein VGL20_21215 [Candidatus Dormibacteraeota bacterium]|jgi:hypothetical protein